MATVLNQITRSNAEALIPQQISDEIIQMLPTQSVALRLMRPMPRMTSKQTKIPVMTGLATAGFVTGDSGQKPTTNLTWDNVFITAEELTRCMNLDVVENPYALYCGDKDRYSQWIRQEISNLAYDILSSESVIEIKEKREQMRVLNNAYCDVFGHDCEDYYKFCLEDYL